jgi:hypothetical protein
LAVGRLTGILRLQRNRKPQLILQLLLRRSSGSKGHAEMLGPRVRNAAKTGTLRRAPAWGKLESRAKTAIFLGKFGIFRLVSSASTL